MLMKLVELARMWCPKLNSKFIALCYACDLACSCYIFIFMQVQSTMYQVTFATLCLRFAELKTVNLLHLWTQMITITL